MPDKTDPIEDDPTKNVKDLDEPLRPEGYRALLAEKEDNRRLKEQLAEMKAFKEKFEASENEKLTEAQKWQKKFNDADAKLKKYELEKEVSSLKQGIAEAAGVPVELLAGDSKEALEAHAELLKQHFGPKTPEPNPYLGSEQGAQGDEDSNAKTVLGF
ncbi:MAG: hypothetical protein LC723_12285 [Actinobacteria bacterium]|nr:hypothetical protein [Actinomycetota bacterium]